MSSKKPTSNATDKFKAWCLELKCQKVEPFKYLEGGCSARVNCSCREPFGIEELEMVLLHCMASTKVQMDLMNPVVIDNEELITKRLLGQMQHWPKLWLSWMWRPKDLSEVHSKNCPVQCSNSKPVNIRHNEMGDIHQYDRVDWPHEMRLCMLDKRAPAQSSQSSKN